MYFLEISVAAFAAALLVAMDPIGSIYTDGHRLVGWSILWAFGVSALVFSAISARRTATHLRRFRCFRAGRRARQRSDAYPMALAENDPRLLGDIEAAIPRAHAAKQSMDQALGRAWLARHPVGTFNAGYQGVGGVNYPGRWPR